MGSQVTFAKGVLAEICAAAAASPDEVCGLLFGTPDHVEAAQPCRNVAAAPATTFEIDPAQLVAAYREARRGGPVLIGCYHSHPSGDAMPSPCDASAAEANSWLWLIVTGGELRAFRAVEEGTIYGRFDPVLVR